MLVICFDGQDLELEFHVHHDCNYGSTAVVIEQHKSTRLLYGIVSAAVLAMVGLVFLLNYGEKGNELKYEDLKKFESSVYIIKVDSVQWLNIIDGDTTLIHPTKVLNNEIPIGTAFLTNDGKLITARHCVEYWIGDKIDLNTEVDTLDDDDIIKWAILTETHMYQREDEGEDAEQRIRVFCSVYDKNAPSEPKFTFSSTNANVHINTENDDIVELIDYDSNYYWRTVRPYFVDRSMELGDIIYVDVPEKGNIVLADSNTLKKIDPSTKVAILGFGANSSLKNEIIPAEGTMKMTVNNYHLDRSLVFEANITHGHSGGPVFIQDGSDIVVVGVVSKVDTESDGTLKMAVPITEITNMANQPEQQHGNE